MNQKLNGYIAAGGSAGASPSILVATTAQSRGMPQSIQECTLSTGDAVIHGSGNSIGSSSFQLRTKNGHLRGNTSSPFALKRSPRSLISAAWSALTGSFRHGATKQRMGKLDREVKQLEAEDRKLQEDAVTPRTTVKTNEAEADVAEAKRLATLDNNHPVFCVQHKFNPVSEPPPLIPPINIPPLFALVIGINKYESIELATLKGAVADADAIQQYLQNDLNVPSFQIYNLRNEDATRSEIIKAFLDLKDNPRINHGDPILIYYAGQSVAVASTPWDVRGSGSQLQLIPHDFGTKIDVCNVSYISNSTINQLLNLIAEAKGNNITFILDCCYAGSGMGFFPNDFMSHVRLVACGANEIAKEEQGRGIFTKALLETLSAAGTNVTYTGLISQMRPLPSQNPLCEGKNRSRILFDRRAASPGRVLYAVRRIDNEYVMEAGAVHGITEGAEFAVYKDQDWPPKVISLGTLIVVKTKAFSAIMKAPPGTSLCAASETTFALQIQSGTEEDLRVSIDNSLISLVEALQQAMPLTGSVHRRFSVTETDKADFGIVLENNRVTFYIFNTPATHYRFNRIPFGVSLNVCELSSVIHAAAHYHWHLRRSNKSSPLRNKIRIEFTKLAQSLETFDTLMTKSDGPNLNVDGVVELMVDTNPCVYRITIVSDTRAPLYPSLFLFADTDLSITTLYEPPRGQFSAPLAPNGIFTIGCPISLPAGRDVNVSLLKVFLATEHGQTHKILQLDPDVSLSRIQTKPIPTWDTFVVTVVQRRVPRSPYIITSLHG